MITATPTNVAKSGNGFTVFVQFSDATEESFSFSADDTKETVLENINQRLKEKNSLEAKISLISKEILTKEITL